MSLSKPLTANGSKSSIDPRFAQWFPLSLDWLKTLWGDFPLGEEYLNKLVELNQNLGLLQKPLGLLKRDQAIWEIVTREIPQLQDLSANYEAVSLMSLERLSTVAAAVVSESALNRIQQAIPAGQQKEA